MSNKRRNRGCVVVLYTLIISYDCSRQSGSATPASAIPQVSFRYAEQIGMARIQAEKREGCLVIANTAIQPGAKLTLIDQPVQNAQLEASGIYEANIVERLSEVCDSYHMTSNELRAEGPVYYRIRTAPMSASADDYMIAIVEPSGPVAVKDGKIEADLDSDGTKETFRACLSSEGAHYQVWTGEPLTGRPRWHWYVYAGYDTEPSCTEKEYFGPK